MHLDDAALDGVRAPLSERTGAAGDPEHRLARNRAALVIPAGQVRVRTAGTRREVVNAEPALDGGLIGQSFSSQPTAWPGGRRTCRPGACAESVGSTLLL